MGHGKQWSNSDDIKLCHAWCNVRQQESIDGCRLSRAAFNEQVAQEFNKQQKEERQRGVKAITTHYIEIRRDVLKFQAVLEENAMPGNGVTATEAAATAAGHASEDNMRSSSEERVTVALTAFEERLQREFKYRHCWDVLKDLPVWQNQKRSRAGRPSSLHSEITVDLDLDGSESGGASVFPTNAEPASSSPSCKRPKCKVLPSFDVAKREISNQQRMADATEVRNELLRQRLNIDYEVGKYCSSGAPD